MKINGIETWKVIEELIRIMMEAESNATVRKPVSWALYQVWKKIDETEKNRKAEQDDFKKDGEEE